MILTKARLIPKEFLQENNGDKLSCMLRQEREEACIALLDYIEPGKTYTLTLESQSQEKWLLDAIEYRTNIILGDIILCRECADFETIDSEKGYCHKHRCIFGCSGFCSQAWQIAPPKVEKAIDEEICDEYEVKEE